jgi:hypothetical protein
LRGDSHGFIQPIHVGGSDVGTLPTYIPNTGFGLIYFLELILEWDGHRDDVIRGHRLDELGKAFGMNWPRYKIEVEEDLKKEKKRKSKQKN